MKGIMIRIKPSIYWLFIFKPAPHVLFLDARSIVSIASPFAPAKPATRVMA